MKKFGLLISFILLTTQLAWGQTTFNWNFGTTVGNAAPSSGSLVNLTVGNVTIGNTNGTVTMLSTTSASSGYTGSSGLYNAGNASRTGALNIGASGSAYFEFTLTPAAGYYVQLSEISFGTRSTSTAPQAYTLRSSLDSYSSDLATGSISNNSTWSLKSNTGLNVQSTNGTAITFRIYGYNGSGSAGANTINWRIDDLQIIVALISVGVNTPPVIGSPLVSLITVNTVQLSADITSDGGVAVTSRGFVYAETATNNDPALGGTGVANVTSGSGTGSFSESILGLSEFTQYTLKDMLQIPKVHHIPL